MSFICSIQVYLSCISNKGLGLYPSLQIVLLAIPNALIWAYVAKNSKDLILNGLIYDITITIVYVAGFALMGEAARFGVVHWLGVVLIVAGLVFLHL